VARFLTRTRYRLVSFDLDGTLLVESSSWVKLHKHFETLSSADQNLAAYERREIDYAEFMRRDVALWPERLHISTIRNLLSDYRLAPDAHEVVRDLRRSGYETAIVTCGLSVLAEKVGRRLGINHVLANELVIDEKGFLTGEVVYRVDLYDKGRSLAELAKRLRIPLSATVAVGDSRFDRSFLEAAGLGVAYRPDPELKPHASFVIQRLGELQDILKEP